jgi:lambda repressor-like predicted transcriptional regulator
MPGTHPGRRPRNADTQLQWWLICLILDALNKEGISQGDLAARAGYSEKHVSQVLRGRVPGVLETWQNLLDAAGVQGPWKDVWKDIENVRNK